MRKNEAKNYVLPVTIFDDLCNSCPCFDYKWNECKDVQDHNGYKTLPRANHNLNGVIRPEWCPLREVSDE